MVADEVRLGLNRRHDECNVGLGERVAQLLLVAAQQLAQLDLSSGSGAPPRWSTTTPRSSSRQAPRGAFNYSRRKDRNEMKTWSVDDLRVPPASRPCSTNSRPQQRALALLGLQPGL
ncbi:MAG: hypothetical protein E6J41_26585 [Chloroflexi bacterium]|nr:MAG: hypothetical protein E6J41_26585 [Chloroflexota bacterium]